MARFAWSKPLPGRYTRQVMASDARPSRAPESEAWLSLGEAAAHLGVHESTLRRWADLGRVSCRRTAGGHRRFNRVLLEREAVGAASPRRGSRYAPDEPWHRPFVSAGLIEQCRTLGQRLAGVVAQFMLGADPQRQLTEARTIGRSYGRMCREAEVGLAGGMEAYLYYRDRFLDIVGTSAESGLLEPVAHFDLVMGEVLLGFAEEAMPVEPG